MNMVLGVHCHEHHSYKLSVRCLKLSTDIGSNFLECLEDDIFLLAFSGGICSLQTLNCIS